MSNSSIILQDVCVQYPPPNSKRLRDYFSSRPDTTLKPSLSKINLTIKKGERVGLIGLNGAGKSTLLKVMARIYQPSSGIAQTTGHVCPLFEFATGFEMELNGWANIQIRAMLLGMSRKEIKEKIKEIGAFTELGEYLNYPVRTYSSGMFVRLAFAVSTSINPEVLLLDEVVGAGDLAFTHKAQKRMDEFMNKGQIMVLSSHAPDLIKKFCSRTIWLHKGTIQMDGPTAEVWNAYTKSIP